MLAESTRQSAVPTGVFVPATETHEEKLARLRASVHLYEPLSGSLAGALVRRSLQRSPVARAAGAGRMAS